MCPFPASPGSCRDRYAVRGHHGVGSARSPRYRCGRAADRGATEGRPGPRRALSGTATGAGTVGCARIGIENVDATERPVGGGAQVPPPPHPGHLRDTDRRSCTGPVIGRQPRRPAHHIEEVQRRRVQRMGDDRRLADHRRPARARPIDQRQDPARLLASPPHDHRLAGPPDLRADLRVRQPAGGRQHNPRSLHMPGSPARRPAHGRTPPPGRGTHGTATDMPHWRAPAPSNYFEPVTPGISRQHPRHP